MPTAPVRDYILFYINGNRREIRGEAVLQTLLVYLRQTERLTGTKLGCGEGGCGACTVMLSHHDPRLSRIVHRAVNSCLIPVAACDGCSVTTVEAVGDRNGNLAPVQQVLVNSHASQCGFCTPGFVMSMYAVLRDHAADPSRPPLTSTDVHSALDGNLCRCTGYRPILDAFKGLILHNAKPVETCSLGDKCCRSNGSESAAHQTIQNASPRQNGNSLVPEPEGAAFVDREFVFPPELITYVPVELNVAGGKWLRPVDLTRLIILKVQHPSARIIVGNTELGIETRFKNLQIPTFLCTSHVPDLYQISEFDEGIRIGASVTWTQLNAFVSSVLTTEAAKEQSVVYKYNSLRAISAQLRWFAGNQIRNVAAVGGNIVTASPISDVNPIFMAAGAQFVVLDCTSSARRTVNSRDFFQGYRKVDMGPSEILLHVIVPWNESSTDFVEAFKVSRRRDDDIAIVSAGIRLHLVKKSDADPVSPKQYKISNASISFGGLAPKTIAAPEVEAAIQGKTFERKTMDDGLEMIARMYQLDRNVPGGMAEFRQSLALGFLFKAFVRCATAVDKQYPSSGVSMLSALGLNEAQTILDNVEDIESSGVQIAADCPPLKDVDHTGKSICHLSASMQVSGEATYLDDIPPFHGELQAFLVLSSEPHANIVNVNYSKAENMPGVYRIVHVDDVRGSNKIGQVYDEFCFAEHEITTIGQVVAIVTADTVEDAKAAAKAVEIEYEKKTPIITIDEAIEHNSFAPNVSDRIIRKGNTVDAMKEYEKKGQVIEGCARIGAQEHWYLEPQGTIAVPQENGEMLILSSTQTPSKTQAAVARVLGVPMHKVVCKVKRIGGGFGGKETRNFFLTAAAAVAAQATKKTVRLILDRDTDMLITGTRHAFLGKYRAAYEPNGKIVAVDMNIYLNMGNSTDLSIPVLDRSLYHSTSCYNIDNIAVVGKACLTHSPSNTAFRGFGGPQGMLIAENVIEHVAWASKQPPHVVRDLNIYGKHGNESLTPYGMNFNGIPLVSCWDEVLRDATFLERRDAVYEFNKTHEFRKRGISALATMFGISFTFTPLDQAGALVHIYSQDGSVLISHGGVEMGQGLHTKMCQVAATELGVALDKVFISETATDKVPNASPTAASASSDMYGMAVRYACEELNKRLAPAKERLGPEASWEDVINDAWFNRVSLSAVGFYKIPNLDDVDLSEEGAQGRPFYYFTNGASVSEVEIDTLTGEMTIIRTDIVMDVGRPLNPAIDVGQIEGAFIQGLGWCTMEEVVRGSSQSHAWLRPGQMHTLGPGTYKIPAANDIPKDFRVKILNSWNEQDTIHSSKAIGEPPLFLASSVFFAIRDAIGAARRQRGLNDFFELDSPASVERIRMACTDDILDRVARDGVIRRPSITL